MNFANRTLFHGDNLGFLQGLDSGSVHLIATDPPFNKGRDFHATPDSLAAGGSFEDRWSREKDVHDDWIDAIKDFDAQRKRTKKGGEYQQELGGVWTAIEAADTTWGKDMGAFLCYMGVRLLEMRRVLAEDGSLYLHCDPTASHYLKVMLDAIFGRRNFRNEIAWVRVKGAGKTSQYETRKFGNSSDRILFYGKSASSSFHAANVAAPYGDLESAFPYSDEKGRYKRRSPFRPPGLGPRPNLCYEYKGVSPPHSSGWTVKREKLEQLDKDGELEWMSTGKVYRKQRVGIGVVPNDIWGDIGTLPLSDRYGYATQKPLALYRRIIRASSNPGDVVLDPFAGCATTVVAAEQEGRQWLGMDIWDGAHKAVVQRLLSEGMLRPGGVPDSMLADLTLPDSPQAALGFGELHYATTPPERMDAGDIAAPAFTLRAKRAVPRWQRLSRADIAERLERAQAGGDGKTRGVICGGCGIVLASPLHGARPHAPPRGRGRERHHESPAALRTLQRAEGRGPDAGGTAARAEAQGLDG